MKPMTKKTLGVAMASVLASALAPPNVRADDYDDAIKRLSSAPALFQKFVKACSQYEALEKVQGCVAADEPGAGVACPPLQFQDHSQDPVEACNASIWDEISAALNANGVARLSTSAKAGKQAVVKASIQPMKQVGIHNHAASHAPAGTCVEQWVKRQDRVNGYWAVYDVSEVSVSVPLPADAAGFQSFEAEVRNTQGATGEFRNVVMCGWEKHAGERSCAPTAPTCRGHADCANLPCGEWICEEGQCRQVQVAPDGTSCAGGTCAGGVCRPSNP